MMEINQILPTISPRDAIGNEVIEIRNILRDWGYTSDIYAENIHPEIQARIYTEYEKKSSNDNILIFHYSIGSDVSNFVKRMPDKKILRYHGVAPRRCLEGINDHLTRLLVLGKEDLKYYPNITSLAVANSDYSKLELESIGFENIDVMPLLLNYTIYNTVNKQLLNNNNNNEYVTILSVGRINPQKRQDEIIKIFYYYNHLNPMSRLFLIGSYNGFEKYYQQLNNLIHKLNLKNVYLTGSVPTEDLVAYYKLADIFICMSDWESFFVPLVESMLFNLPIIAYNTAAVPYTLRNSGILVNKKNYVEIAEMINFIVEHDIFKKTILRKQRSVLKYYDRKNVIKKFKEIIENLCDE